jgi:antitoxin component YwqK of YwqJK toxin-antitoxin module
MRYTQLFNWCLALISSSLLIACAEEKVADTPLEKSERSLVEEVDGVYTEWYAGHKQVKVKGRKDAQGRKQGVWKMFTEDGYELSIQTYRDGKKHGAVVVYHSNGALHYSGEYDEDERIGEWKFYDEMGDLVTIENFDKQPQAD